MHRHVLIATMVAVSAMTGLAPAQDGTTLFRTDTRLVMLHASVSDASGKLVTDLPQNAFRVFENGVEQSLKVFRREDVPISLGLIVDSSASMQNKRRQVQAAALDLVKSSNPADEVFIVSFNEYPSLSQRFTTDVKDMERSLSKMELRGGTAMRDALQMSIEYLKRNGKEEKKVLLLITDGADNLSSTSLETLMRIAQENEVVIHAIGLLSEEEKREAERAKRALTAITQATGGQAFYPTELAEVNAVALQVAHDIRNQYVLAYSPSNQELDSSFRQIRVTVNAPNGHVVRTRSGYYAIPQPRSSLRRQHTPLYVGLHISR